MPHCGAGPSVVHTVSCLAMMQMRARMCMARACNQSQQASLLASKFTTLCWKTHAPVLLMSTHHASLSTMTVAHTCELTTMAVQQSTWCWEAVLAYAHARWGVHCNGAHNAQRGHGDGNFARRERPSMQWARNRARVQLICVLICLRVRTTDECHFLATGKLNAHSTQRTCAL